MRQFAVRRDDGPDCPSQNEPSPFPLPPEVQAKIDKATAAAIETTKPISENEQVAYATITFDSATDVPTETASTIVDDVEAANGQNGCDDRGQRTDPAFAGQEPPSGELIGILVAIIILLIAFGSVIAAGLPIVTAVFRPGAG